MKVIHILRKPCSEPTVAVNVLRHGTGGLNVDRSRVQMSSEDREIINSMGGFGIDGWVNTTSSAYNTNNPKNPMIRTQAVAHQHGRWPANLVLQHLEGCVEEGTKKVKSSNANQNNKTVSNRVYGGFNPRGVSGIAGYADPDGTETIPAWVCVPGCPVAGLDDQSGVLKSGALPYNQYTTVGRDNSSMFAGDGVFTHKGYDADTGGASRFFKQVKP